MEWLIHQPLKWSIKDILLDSSNVLYLSMVRFVNNLHQKNGK
jgi:hypothetical protein